MNTSPDLTTGIHESAFGFERWTFRLCHSAVIAAASKAARMGDPEYLKELPGFYWTQQARRPDRREVSELKISRPDSEGLVEISAILKRGHYSIAEFFRSHSSPSARLEGEVVELSCSCHSNSVRIPLASLPSNG